MSGNGQKKLSAASLKLHIDQQIAGGMGNPLPEAKPGDSAYGTSVIRLKVTEVGVYEYNPRTQENEKYPDILASIESRGLEQALYITKRPGSNQWILARGGKTRLTALQALAAKDPAKWLYHDFLIKLFSKESDLLASHLIENIQRSDMSFWDTAKGLMTMRDEMVKELSFSLNLKDFGQRLKGTGLDTAERDLQEYFFAIGYLAGLGDLSQKLAKDHVRSVLRPQYQNLRFISAKAAEGDTEGFDTLYLFWVESYPNEHKTYDCSSLQKHINFNVSQYLNVSEDELAMMVEGYKRNNNATFDELRIPPFVPPAAPLLPAMGSSNHQTGFAGGQDDDHEHGDRDGNGDGDDFNPLGKHDLSGASAPHPDAGLANLAATLGGGVGNAGGMRGLKVASGLTPKPKTSEFDDGARYIDNSDRSGSGQDEFPGMSGLDAAQAQLQISLHEFAEIAGINAQLLPAPGMPLGFYMEVPKASVLGTSAELPLQAWWFLANLSGQANSDMDATLDKVDHTGAFALPDTGPNGYRHALADDEAWARVVAQNLGGMPLVEAAHVFAIVTDAQHPLCDAAIQLLSHIRTLRMYQTEALKATGAAL